ncbi:hypothetical protein AVEN_132454-1, partial [Araneus ventricosus]
EPFLYLAERFNPCHGKLCDNPLPSPTTRFPKPFRQAFFAIWAVLDDFRQEDPPVLQEDPPINVRLLLDTANY